MTPGAYDGLVRRLLSDERFRGYCAERGLSEGETRALATLLVLADLMGDGDAYAGYYLLRAFASEGRRRVVARLMAKVLGDEKVAERASRSHVMFFVSILPDLRAVAKEALSKKRG